MHIIAIQLIWYTLEYYLIKVHESYFGIDVFYFVLLENNENWKCM